MATHAFDMGHKPFALAIQSLLVNAVHGFIVIHLSTLYKEYTEPGFTPLP